MEWVEIAHEKEGIKLIKKSNDAGVYPGRITKRAPYLTFDLT